jgi:hypothetical protein
MSLAGQEETEWESENTPFIISSSLHNLFKGRLLYLCILLTERRLIAGLLKGSFRHNKGLGLNVHFDVL